MVQNDLRHFCSRDAANIEGLAGSKIEDLYNVRNHKISFYSII
jgi:NAD-dependent DNA ligase